MSACSMGVSRIPSQGCVHAAPCAAWDKQTSQEAVSLCVTLRSLCALLALCVLSLQMLVHRLLTAFLERSELDAFRRSQVSPP